MIELVEPLNERDTIFFFNAIQEYTPWRLAYCGKPFPDAIISNGYETLLAEFEYKATNFIVHRHDPKECDLIICWVNDWADAPVSILSLSDMASIFNIDIKRQEKKAPQKYYTIGMSRETKTRFDALRADQKHDVILNKMMDLWQGMSEGERGAIFDRVRDAKDGTL